MWAGWEVCPFKLSYVSVAASALKDCGDSSVVSARNEAWCFVLVISQQWEKSTALIGLGWAVL